jgi:hypothetical protein
VKDLPIRIKENNKKTIFVNCIFDAQSEWNLKLGFTTSYLNKQQAENIDSATVFVINSFGDTIRLQSKGQGQYTHLSTPKKCIKYTLKVIVAGYDTLSAIDSIPVGTAVIESFAYDTLNYTPVANGEGGLVYLPALRLNMHDSDVRLKSFYYFLEKSYLKKFAKDSSTKNIDSALAIYNGITDLKIDDLQLNPLGIGYGTVLLSDASFNSSNYTVKAHTRDYFKYYRDIDFSVVIANQEVIMRQPNFFGVQLWQYCLSESLYKYYYSYFRQAQANYDYFGDFLYVSGNIKNGYGIFAGREVRRLNLTW